MNIRPFRETDTPSLIELFRQTVHTVCAVDYSPEQLAAWAPPYIDAARWSERFSKTFTFIAEEERTLTGFANIEASGYIDMFYVGADWQRRGVGTLLLARLEVEAMRLKLARMYSDVSITARSFFTRHGFAIEREYSKNVNGILFHNAIMTKTIL